MSEITKREAEALSRLYEEFTNHARVTMADLQPAELVLCIEARLKVLKVQHTIAAEEMTTASKRTLATEIAALALCYLSRSSSIEPTKTVPPVYVGDENAICTRK